MRKELSSIGVTELTTPAEVEEAFSKTDDSMLLVVNSVCGCAAGGARPAVAIALQHETLPTRVTTVFAGQDKEATDAARAKLAGYPPSSPSMALLKNGEVVQMLHRLDIEGFTAEQIAGKLTSAFDEHLK
ncbi:UNVERIFIED_CONTAM: hypothetical protein GTU68_021971 [Idotea baltica]|nr:hypothetical protein [Idotea baltica]